MLFKFLAGNVMRQMDTELELDVRHRSDIDWYRQFERLSTDLFVDGFRFGHAARTDDETMRIPIEQYGQAVSAAEAWYRLFPDDPSMYGKVRVFVSWSQDTIDQMEPPGDSIRSLRRWNRAGVPGFALFERYIDVVRRALLSDDV